jgi:hypothetical protein
MDSQNLQAMRGYQLASAPDPRRVNCDELGPALGPVRLLQKTASGLAPLPLELLNSTLGSIFGLSLDCSDLEPALCTIANAINEGALARGMIGTQLLHLPELSESEAHRAAMIADMLKAAPDDPQHPGWPKDAPGGIGGEFRPKDSDSARTKAVLNEAVRRAHRKAIKIALSRILNPRRGIRLAAEAAADVTPILDIVGAAATAEDIAEIAEEFETLRVDTKAATDFVSEGAHSLEELRMNSADESFSSYESFLKEELAKRYGRAGDGFEYHHIVEQSAEGDIPMAELQSTRNIVRIPKYLHEEISAEFSKPISSEPGAPSLRASLRGKSFEERYEAGLKVMREIGIVQ